MVNAMKFPQMMRLLRRDHQLSHADLRRKMDEYGQHVSIQLLSKWENGHSTPTLAQFFALCEILDVDNPAEVFSDYRTAALDPVGLRKVREYRADLIATGLYRPEERQPDAPSSAPSAAARSAAPVRLRPLYLLAASGGTGQYLDSCAYEMTPLDEDAPDCVSFGIRVAGDSMEPRYADGSVVWVQKSETIEPGQVGIFYLDGDSYIKQFRQGEQGPELVSLNPAYAPIRLRESSDFRVFGRVIGQRRG